MKTTMNLVTAAALSLGLLVASQVENQSATQTNLSVKEMASVETSKPVTATFKQIKKPFDAHKVITAEIKASVRRITAHSYASSYVVIR